jgi:single-stranded-DNA-specific exonuclease
MCGRTGLSPTAAAILVNRGFDNFDEADRFLSGTFRDVESPFLMKDLDKAARRLAAAGAALEPVLVYGDYDVDGATGAACLALFLTEVFPGLPVRIHQNHRVVDGYGLRNEHLDAAAADGYRLVVTVDCGVSDLSAVRHAAASGMEVIVTDHHIPGPDLPPAFAVVNPRRSDCPFPEKDLAGVGVVFMLISGIRRVLGESAASPPGREPELRRYLDLVALGTVSDMVPLRGVNRLFVKAGIEEIRRRPRPGIQALMAVAGVTPEALNETDLGFRIGPRLNAAGRVGESRRSSDILMTSDRAYAFRLAAELNLDNTRRQREEERILRSAEAALEEGPPVSTLGAIVLDDPRWHLGVLGIVASKLAERFCRPVVLLRREEGTAKGSCRSAGDFPMVGALSEVSHLLTRFGGHAQAAGVVLPDGNLPAFREALNRIGLARAEGGGFVPNISVDAQVRLSEISTRFMEELEALRPFGMGNEEPVLLARKVRVTRKNTFGPEGQHLRFEVAGDDRRFEVVAFRKAGLAVTPDSFLDLLFTPQSVSFRGVRGVRLMYRDLCPCAPGVPSGVPA